MTKRVKDDLEKHTVLKQKKGRLNTSARQKHSIDMGTRQNRRHSRKLYGNPLRQ